jgi:hypothetical protein
MTHNDNTDIAVKLRVAADCFGCARFVPSEAELGIELTKEALDALEADLGVRADGVRHVLADPANYDLYQLAPWLDGLANRLTQADNRVLQGISLERPKVQPRRQRKPRHPTPDGLKTAAQAAAKLGCSIKTLNGHIASGALRYVIIGHGTKRPRKMFTDADLDAFITAQTRKDSPCPFTASRVRRSSTSNSASEVIAFTDQPKPRPGGTRKR